MAIKPDPLGTPRHALVVYLLCLAIVSGVVTALGEPASGSVEAALHPAIVRTWGVVLLAGGSSALAGMYWQGDLRTGLVLKRFGYVALAVASSVYAVIVVGAQRDLGGLLAGGIVLGFAIACAHTAWRVDQRIRWIVGAS